MDALRSRIGAALEWLVAAAFLAATVVVGSLIVGALARLERSRPAVAAPAPVPTPPGIPAGAISVPMLLLFDGRAIRLGDPVSRVATLLGRAAETGADEVHQGSLGDRRTRFYELAGTHFILVFDRPAAQPEPRVAAIFVQ